jgi:pimeloyl-ACP methyl ester carboxylesterase
MTSEARTLEHRGCRLHYRVRGDGPPVLFVQGVGLHGDGWTPQVDGLSERYRCLTFDNRGMGQSQPHGTRSSVEQMAEDACMLIDAQGWRSAHVIGHSLGGLVAMQLALAAPERVRSLSLLCTLARGRDATKLTWWMLKIGVRTKLGTRRMRRLAFLEMVMPPAALAGADRDALAERLHPLFGHDLADQPPVVMKQLAALRRCDLTTRLPELTGIPTLVLSATHDRVAPVEHGRALAAAIPGARYVEIPDAAHGVTIQCADRINALLDEHLAGAEAAPAQPVAADG